MQDWRIITGQEEFFNGLELKEVKFPEFWEQAYRAKNDFYKFIENEAINFVRKYNRGEEFLSDERIQKFWHAHCEFCTEKITAEDLRICYCTADYSVWICKNCFDDFCERFGFRLLETK